MEQFAERLNAIMEEKHLKQVNVIRLANAIGEKSGIHIGKSHMSQYCSGKTVPRADILNILSRALEVSQLWLQGEDVPREAAHPYFAQGEMMGAHIAVRQFASGEMIAGRNGSQFFSPKDAMTGKTGSQLISLGDAVAEGTLSHPRTLVRYPLAGNGTAGENTPDTYTAGRAHPGEAASKGADDGRGREASGGNILRELSTKENSTENKWNESRGENKMRIFQKSYKLNDVLYDVRGPVVDEANRMIDSGMNILKLNIGNPAPFGFRTPEEVIYDMRQQLTECEGYSDSKGLFSARKAIMQYAQIKNIPNVTISDVYTGNGVSELINLCMQALLDDGDEILIPSPDYPLWTATATLAGGKAVHYVCDEESEWYPDLADMERKITDKTKAIVIINPNNPTGALYPKEILEKIAELARRHQLILFSDEIYDRLVMDGEEHVSIASLAPDLFCVTFSGLSKSHMIAGFRIGWMVLSGNKDIARDYIEGINMLSNMRLCSNVPAQSIVQTALWGYQSVKKYIVPGGRIYEQREYVYKALNDIPGITAVKPKAAFYIFPKLDTKKFNIFDDEKFALDFLKEKRVLVVQGSGFNWKQPDHFRVVYLPRIEVLEEAMGNLADFLATYRQ